MKSKSSKNSARFPWVPLVLFILTGVVAAFWALQENPASTRPASTGLPARPDVPKHGPPPVNEAAAMPELPDHPTAGLTVLTDTTLQEDHDFEGGDYDVLVKISASDVTLDCGGFRISGATSYGLLVENVSNVTVQNCHFEGPFQGLLADNAEKLTVFNSSFTVHTNGMHAFHADKLFLDSTSFLPKPAPSKGFAVEIKDARGVTVRKNRLSGFDQGLLLYGIDGFEARDNQIDQITETGIGTFQMDKERITQKGTIEGNTIRGCMMGLEIHAGSREIRIEGNDVTDCTMAVRLDDGYDTPSFNPIKDIRFAGNTFVDNRDANEILVTDKKEIVWEE